MHPAAHPWDVSPTEAVAIQQHLRGLVHLAWPDRPVRLIGGVDLSYEIRGTECWAAIVLLDPDTMQVQGYAGVQAPMRFPYVPGLLSFREVPALMQAWALLPQHPDLLFVDGHGIAHPRRMGIACHLGLLTGVPSIGCGKSHFVGSYDEPATPRGACSALTDGGEVVGSVLRTRDRVKPVFVSPGHLIDTDTARDWTLRCVRGYRIPEPTRQAHLTVNALRRGELPTGYVTKKAGG